MSSDGTQHRDPEGSELNLAMPVKVETPTLRSMGFSREIPEPTTMSAERGWIGEPQAAKEWHESRASAASRWVEKEIRRRQERGDDRPVTVAY